MPGSSAGLGIEKVVVKAVIPGGISFRPVRATPEEPKRGEDALGRFGPGQISPGDRHGVGGKPKPNGRDARRSSLSGCVSDQSVGWICFVQEIVEGFPLDGIEQAPLPVARSGGGIDPASQSSAL